MLKSNKFFKAPFYCKLLCVNISGKLIIVLVFSFFITACLNFSIGNKPNISALEDQLILGQSTSQDILIILGKPFAEGSEMFPFRSKPRKMYTYYYEEGSLEDDRRIILFVFIADNRYDGYLWFSSLPEFKP